MFPAFSVSKIKVGPFKYTFCGMLISAVHNAEGEEKLHLLMLDNHIPMSNYVASFYLAFLFLKIFEERMSLYIELAISLVLSSVNLSLIHE